MDIPELEIEQPGHTPLNNTVDFLYTWSVMLVQAIIYFIAYCCLLAFRSYYVSSMLSMFVIVPFGILPFIDLVVNNRKKQVGYILMFLASTSYFAGYLLRLLYVWLYHKSFAALETAYTALFLFSLACNIISLLFVKQAANKKKFLLLNLSYLVYNLCYLELFVV